MLASIFVLPKLLQRACQKSQIFLLRGHLQYYAIQSSDPFRERNVFRNVEWDPIHEEGTANELSCLVEQISVQTRCYESGVIKVIS